MTEYEDLIQDIVQETLVAHPELEPDREWLEGQCRDFIRRKLAQHESLRRAFAQFVLEGLQPIRLPGIVELPEVANLEEVQSMLADRATEWTQAWKQEGIKEGLDQGRGVLLQNLEGRFGPMPEEVRHRVDAIASIAELTEFSFRAGAASSLAELTIAP